MSIDKVSLKRRTFGGLLLSACAMTSLGATDKRNTMEPFHWGRLKFDNLKVTQDNWNAVPHADVYMLEELKRRTRLNIDTTRYTAYLENLDEMCQFPFLFMTSDGEFKFTPKQQANLVEYVKRGGFLFAEDCVANDEERVDAFFVDFKEKVEHLFEQKMVKLPNSHPIYHSFYDLNGLPHVQGVEHGGHALFIDGRMAIFLSPSDIHCGWYAQYLDHTGGSPWFEEVDTTDTVSMAVNIFMYVMSH